MVSAGIACEHQVEIQVDGSIADYIFIRPYRFAIRGAAVRELILLNVHQKRDQLVVDVRWNRTVLF